MAHRQREPRRHRHGHVGLVLALALVVVCLVGAKAVLHGGRTTSPHAHDAPALITPAPVVATGTAFASGSCMAYPPLPSAPGTAVPARGARHTVFLDAGHGGPDPGATETTSAGATVLEKDSTLAIAHALLPLLRAQGYRVVLSRIGDTSVTRLAADDIAGETLTLAGLHRDVEARIACANAAQADVLVSLHLNAFDDPTVGGAETYYDSTRPFHGANQRLATLVQANIVAALHAAGWPVGDRGTRDDVASSTPSLSDEAAAYGHLLELGPAAPGWLEQPSTMPGILCEPLFLTDPAEADIVVGAAGQEAIARGLLRAINAFFTS